MLLPTLARQFFSVQLDVINGWKNFVEVFWRRKKKQGICFWVKLFEYLQKNTDYESTQKVRFYKFGERSSR